VFAAVRSGLQWTRRLHVTGRDDKTIAVDAQASPVLDGAGVVVGLTLLLHDVSSEITLEQKCATLHDRATKDPLTQAANRAEFDRTLAEFVQVHRDTKRPCSLIMTDIDRFKSINDTYGHQAGDTVIKSIAQMMMSFSRPGDLVARYGGEEFALLCADCDNATAAKRADEIRVAFSLVRHAQLGDRCVTASFGVTEIQPGDTPETLIRRSDRALMQAKETGRNRVVQLGIGGDAREDEAKPTAAASKKRLAGNTLLKREMTSDSPLERNVEKLKGFVADHHAEILLTDRNRVQLKLEGDRGGPLFRRGSDRGIRLLMDISLHEETFAPDNNPRAVFKRTRIGVTISPVKSRERRTADALERARQLVVSLRSYLMATDIDGVEAVTEEEGGLWKGLRGLFGGGAKAEA
jgi:diguanylate cyclase (GGDEF)-like protein